ncbi:hypothetical protein ACFVJS_20525 [Nocardioides sp. NPDC057772]|uniref:hypothetical protein n=1 Tax=Nocardioides sp. NPDC057772 TaxID=3346245 RepID=UPI003670F2A8
MGDSMSVADQFGLDDPVSPLLAEAREGWERWCAVDPRLAVVDDLADLREWTRQADVADKAAVLRTLAALTATDRSAVAALVWLLIPGACRVAEGLSDLSLDIDALVASELWVQACQAHRLRTPWLARALLNATRREVAASLGVGSRADRHWKRVLLTDELAMLASVANDRAVLEGEIAPEVELREFLDQAIREHAVEEEDVRLLHELAAAAETVGAPPRRGRLGLTTPAAAELVARDHPEAARTLRRRAARSLDRLKVYAAVWIDDTSGARRCSEQKGREIGAA